MNMSPRPARTDRGLDARTGEITRLSAISQRTLITAQRRRLHERWPAGTPELFPRVTDNDDGCESVGDGVYRKALHRWLQRCDVRDEHGQPVRVVPHSFRHTLGTRLINRDIRRSLTAVIGLERDRGVAEQQPPSRLQPEVTTKDLQEGRPRRCCSQVVAGYAVITVSSWRGGQAVKHGTPLWWHVLLPPGGSEIEAVAYTCSCVGMGLNRSSGLAMW